MPRYFPADFVELNSLGNGSASSVRTGLATTSARASQETLVVDPRCRQSRGSMIDAKVAHVLRFLTAADRVTETDS